MPETLPALVPGIARLAPADGYAANVIGRIEQPNHSLDMPHVIGELCRMLVVRLVGVQPD